MNHSSQVIVAIDGTAGSGKTILGEKLAEKLSIDFFDSGLIYRIITAYFAQISHTTVPSETVKLLQNKNFFTSFLEKLHTVDLVVKKEQDAKSHIILNAEDFTSKLHTAEINENISYISAYEDIRIFATKLLQSIGKNTLIVMAGRDIGTVVFPDSQVKFYITCDDTIRAKRRLAQYSNEQRKISIKEIREMKQALLARDQLDMKREYGPLKKASKAILIDNSYSTIEEIIQIMLEYCPRIGKEI